VKATLNEWNEAYVIFPSSTDNRTNRLGIGWRLMALALLLLGAQAAYAEDCSDYPGGVLDGAAGTPAPSQLYIERNCTIRNYPASNPFNTNISFNTRPGQTNARWLVVFDNVVHTGQMACNSVAGHKIWFTNGSSTAIQDGCQNLLIPVEKIDKANPPGDDTATVGVPFTYTLTMPVLFDPGTGTVINTSGSVNDLHGVTLVDDLNATGVDLTYLGHVAYWLGSAAEVPHTFTNSGGVLSFDDFPIIPAGEQIVIEITVVLDDTVANRPGTQFINTAKWDFGRLIEGVYYEPLPGEWGVTEPMTIAGPDLVVGKTGPATLNLGETGEFVLDVLNSGNRDAWDAILVDRLPDGPAGGMCDLTPQVLSARVFAADGTTPVPGKDALVEGTDFSLSYSAAPACELTLTTLTAAAVIGPGERLVIRYGTELDADSQDGVSLTNVAGAVRWFNADDAVPDRLSYVRTLTDGTPGTVDHEDAHTVTVALSGLFYEKTVANLSTGANPTSTAAPGDTLRYTLRLRATTEAQADLTFYDDLRDLNATPVFVPNSLAVVPGSLPPGADPGNTNSAAGILDVRNLSVPAGGEVSVQFDVTLRSGLIDGAVVLNQADLISGGATIAVSDDPNVNGLADPAIDGDEDPTRVLIETEPPQALAKATTQATAAIGEEFAYRITVPSVPHDSALYNVRILDDLVASAADLEFVSVARVSGSGGWTPVNTGTVTNLVIEDPVNGIDIPAGDQAVIEITVRLPDTSTNVAGLEFVNTAAYTYDLIDDNQSTRRPGDPGTSGPMTIVEPELTLEKSGPLIVQPGIPGTFSLDVHNIGGAPAHGLVITDLLPDSAEGGMCDAAPGQVTAQRFATDGTTPVGPALTPGTDFTLGFDGAPACALTIEVLTDAGALQPGERLILTYQAFLDADTQPDATLVNVAGATRWSSAPAGTPTDFSRDYARTVTDGTVGILDHEDAHTVNLPVLRFEKTVANLTQGSDPATTGSPGDTLRYTLLVENLDDAEVTGYDILDELDRLNATPAFAPGTLVVTSAPSGADLSNTDPAGGSAGTGVLDVRNLTLAPSGGTAVIEFEITLAPVIANGTIVLNQSLLRLDGATVSASDDPNVNGPSDPTIPGDEDPTPVAIVSAPSFEIYKTSSDLTGDPDVLLAGETLRYTLTVRNTGTDHAAEVVLRDPVPANTAYVAGSTTLNGTPVADAGGLSPLVDGLLINSPADPTPGFMPAGIDDGSNVATLTFDVVIDPDVVDGTVVANQAFVSAPGAGLADQPSDDPDTPVADDPTRDVVGNVPLLYAEKAVALFDDQGTAGVVDPGDVLRYTVTIYNQAATPADGVVLTDSVPANTTYVPDSTLLNGLPVGQPDGGVSPLAGGIDVSSSDLTPPLPADGLGTLSGGGQAVVQFDLRVNDGVPAGTVISNQASVASEALPDLLTDGDGDPSTGPEPTVVVVGQAQQLSITKQVSVVGGGPAVAGAQLEYVVRIFNPAPVPAGLVVITDDLDAATPGALTYVDQSAALNGSPAGITFAGSTLTADYSTSYGLLEPGAEAVLRFRAVLAPGLAAGTTVTNTAAVSWNDPASTASASVSVDVGGVPGVASVSGTAWHDADFDNAQGATERTLEGWTVELYRNGQLAGSTATDAVGAWRLVGLAPNDTGGDSYGIRFRAPGAGSRTAMLGLADSPFTDSLQEITQIVVGSGANAVGLNLPIDPNGVVYGSIVRTPIAGAELTLLDAGSSQPLPATCFDDPVQQGQVTGPGGYYKFDLNFSDPACPSGRAYLISVQPPGDGFEPGYSQVIPPTSGPATAPLSVPTCPGGTFDALPATTAYCEAQPSELAPPASVPARSDATRYHVHLIFDAGQLPGTSQAFNNHIPLDQQLEGALAVTKTTPVVNVSRGQLVPYTITVNNVVGVELAGLTIIDRFPAGFRYVEGSANMDGVASEPAVNGLELTWSNVAVGATGQLTIKLLLAVGAGVSEGEYVNRAQVVEGFAGSTLSGEATATVRVVPDPTFDCTDVTGKVFDDRNRNGFQDAGETGLAGVRLVTDRGLAATTDAHGRFHVTCAVTPREGRGSNFTMKLDDRTLPSGFRMSSDQVQIKRATRGKALKFNFGASIHRVVGLDMADPVFVPGSVEIRPQWKPRLALLMEELARAPATLRLSYLADREETALVEARMDAVKSQILESWESLERPYLLTIEPEIFWRLGAPAPRPAAGGTKGR
jgi:uncharacterized repeat protein (TIGR01451 family)